MKEIKRMATTNLRRAVLLAVAATVLPTLSSGAIAVPSPPWMERTAIAEKMIVNGIPSTVHYFQAKRSLEEVLIFYRSRWAEDGTGNPGYREAEAPPWHVISRLEDRYLLVVQAKGAAAASEGYLAITDLQEIDVKNEMGSNIPRLQGSDVVNDLTSTDPGSKGRTVMLFNGFSVPRNSDYYREYYLGRGWGEVVDQETDDARVLVFGRDGSQAHLVISPSGAKTQVVMTLVDGK